MSQQGDRLRRELGSETAQLKAELAVEIAHRIDVAMPVDTGWVRANTVLAVGTPADGPFGSPEDIGTATAAGSAGLAAVVANTDPAVDVHISNAIPYLPRLNKGHSPQAPAGFLEAAVDGAVADVEARVAGRTVKL